MQELINKVLQWGLDKGISGPNGKATALTQAAKMMEEVNETVAAVYLHRDCAFMARKKALAEVVDGIGDSLVTMVLLAERIGTTIDVCKDKARPFLKKQMNSAAVEELHYNASMVFEFVENDDLDRVDCLIGTAWNAAEYLAARFGLRPDECLQAAYDVISKRTGRMENGTFVKDDPIPSQ